jgi:UDP-glucose 4-epimerase
MNDTSNQGDSKIKILFAIGRFSVGGAEKLLLRKVSALNRDKFDAKVITIFKEQTDSFADQIQIDKCFEFRSTFDLFAFWRLYRFLRKGTFDCVVTHLFTANLLVRLAAIFARVPVIIAFEHNIYPQKHRWQIVADRFLSRRTNIIITSSDAAKNFTAQQEGIPLEKFLTSYIPPLLENREPKSEDEIRAGLHILPQAPVILTVSRLVADKGHSYLLQAAKEVLQSHRQVIFLIVGWGPEQENLERQAIDLGIERNVRLPGRMDIQDVLPLAALYVDPAVSTDLPVAIMEAMQEGKAIIATRIGEIPVFVEDGKTGIVIQPKDPRALAFAMERLLSDPNLRATLGLAAREKVKSFSLQAYMKRFEKMSRAIRIGKKSMKKILVTGALGHIGGRLIRELTPQHSSIVLLDNLQSQRYVSLFDLPANRTYQFIEDDILTCDFDALLQTVDVVIHLAAITDAEGTVDKVKEVEAVNFDGLKRVADACLKHNVKLLFPSTTSVYGSAEAKVDETSELKAQSPYAESKRKAEEYLIALAKQGLKVIICRFGTIFGFSSGIRFHTAVNKFSWQAINGKPLGVWKTAYQQRRPYLYLGDCVAAVNFILENDIFDGEIYNILTSNFTVEDVVTVIKEFVPDLNVAFVDSKIMNQLSYDVIDAKFRAKGFAPKGNLRQGIEETIAHFSAIKR